MVLIIELASLSNLAKIQARTAVTRSQQRRASWDPGRSPGGLHGQFVLARRRRRLAGLGEQPAAVCARRWRSAHG